MCSYYNQVQQLSYKKTVIIKQINKTISNSNMKKESKIIKRRYQTVSRVSKRKRVD